MKLITGIVVLTFLYACNHSNFSKDDHPAHFDKIISSASYIISKKGLDKSLQFVDSAYYAFGSVGIGDEWKRLQFKEFKTYSVARLNDDKRLLGLSLVYADSMLNLLSTSKLQNKYLQEYSISNYAKADILFEMAIGYFRPVISVICRSFSDNWSASETIFTIPLEGFG